jgi:hypothetical protein
MLYHFTLSANTVLPCRLKRFEQRFQRRAIHQLGSKAALKIGGDLGEIGVNRRWHKTRIALAWRSHLSAPGREPNRILSTKGAKGHESNLLRSLWVKLFAEKATT